MFQDAVEIRDRLATLVDRLDPDAVSGTAARDLWSVLDASERLCAAGKTLLARRIAATHRSEKAGAKTAAEELAGDPVRRLVRPGTRSIHPRGFPISRASMVRCGAVSCP